MWTFEKFSATQILREINFIFLKMLKKAIFDNFRNSEVLFWLIKAILLGCNLPKLIFRASENGKISNFYASDFAKIDFT